MNGTESRVLGWAPGILCLATVGATLLVGTGVARAAAPSDASADAPGFHLAIGVGGWRPGGNSFIKPSSAGLGGSLKIGYRKNRYLGFEFEGIEGMAEYSGQPIPADPLTFTMYQSPRWLDVGGVALSVRGTAPAGRFGPYAQAGLGFFRSTMEVDGLAVVVIIPFVPTQVKESNVDPALLAAAGLNVRLPPNWFLGLEVRRIWLTETFSRLGQGRIEVGGTAVLVVFGRRFDLH